MYDYLSRGIIWGVLNLSQDTIEVPNSVDDSFEISINCKIAPEFQDFLFHNVEPSILNDRYHYSVVPRAIAGTSQLLLYVVEINLDIKKPSADLFSFRGLFKGFDLESRLFKFLINEDASYFIYLHPGDCTEDLYLNDFVQLSAERIDNILVINHANILHRADQ